MSKQLEPSDLLDEDGTVDMSIIKGIANTAAGGHRRVTPELCDTFRECIGDGMSSKETAEAHDMGATAVRRHVSGECHHPEPRLEEPRYEHIRGEGWVVVDE